VGLLALSLLIPWPFLRVGIVFVVAIVSMIIAKMIANG